MELHSCDTKEGWYEADDEEKAIVKEIQATMVQALASRFFFNPASALHIEDLANSNLI